MIVADLNWLSQVLSSPLVGCDDIDPNQSIQNITTDSRTCGNGEVFVALKGPNFDAHDFIKEVQTKGAIAVIVDHIVDDIDIPQVVVTDTLRALGELGKAVASEVNAKTIAITGSVGKTSVKEMCAQILQQKGQVLATAGNFNNEIGVPLTLLRLESKHQYAVVELGANHLGEIAYTTRLAQPDVAVLNNVAEAHLEGFGDLNGVATAKSEIFEGLKVNGVAIFNRGANYRQQWLDKLQAQFSRHAGSVTEFTAEPEALGTKGASGDLSIQFIATNITLDTLGCATFNLSHANESRKVTLTVPGKHNVSNALAASAACYQIGASLDEIATGLSQAEMVKGRVNLHPVTPQITVIDDSYNANVQSVKAAIELLESYDAKRILVLGDMAELGTEARRLHTEVGEYGLQHNLNNLLSYGVLSQSASEVFEENGGHYSSQTQLLEDLVEMTEQTLAIQTDAKVVVLVKGSRSAKMELVVEQLISSFNNNNNKGNVPC